VIANSLPARRKKRKSVTPQSDKGDKKKQSLLGNRGEKEPAMTLFTGGRKSGGERWKRKKEPPNEPTNTKKEEGDLPHFGEARVSRRQIK